MKDLILYDRDTGRQFSVSLKNFLDSLPTASEESVSTILVKQGDDWNIGSPALIGSGTALDDPTKITVPAKGSILGHKIVKIRNNFAEYADIFDVDILYCTVGMSLNSAVDGENVVVKLFGKVVEPTWTFESINIPIFLGESGTFSFIPPENGIMFQIGSVINTTAIHISPRIPILRGGVDTEIYPDNTVYINGSPVFCNDEVVVYDTFEHINRLVYDDSYLASGEYRLVYADNEVLVFGDEVLLFGDEELIYDVDGPYVASGYVATGYVKEGI